METLFIIVLFALLLMVMKSCFGLWGHRPRGLGYLFKTLRYGDFVHYSPFCFALDGDEIMFRSVWAICSKLEEWRLIDLLLMMKSCFGLWGHRPRGLGYLLKTLRNGDFVHHSPFCFALDGDEIVFRSVGAQTEGVGLFVQNSEEWRLCSS
jgi:hypothetical protein